MLTQEKTEAKKESQAEQLPLNSRWVHLTPFLQLVAVILSDFFYDDLVGFTLEFVYRRVVAVGHDVGNWLRLTESCVQFYDESFELLTTIGSLGSGEGQFHAIPGLCFDKSRRIIFACDCINHRIHKIDESGRSLCCFGEVLEAPQQLSLSPDCSTLAVAVSNKQEVLVFSAETGELLRRSEAVFTRPRGVCHLLSDELLVSDSDRVSLVEAASLKVKSEFTSDEFEWENPWHIALDESKGVVFVCDVTANRVAQFSKSGDYLGSIASHGGEPLNHPKLVAVDAAGILFVGCRDGIRVFDEANSRFDDDFVAAIAIIDL